MMRPTTNKSGKAGNCAPKPQSTGKTAYEIAVEQGFIGSEIEWIKYQEGVNAELSKSQANRAESEANRAEEAADISQTNAENTELFAIAAEDSAIRSNQSAILASESEVAAKSSETYAGQSADNAQDSANAAKASENSALSSATKSEEQANIAIEKADIAVTEAERSESEADRATYEADKARVAADFAELANESTEENRDAIESYMPIIEADREMAQESALEAKASEISAKVSEEASSLSEQKAKESENNAKASETASKASENKAAQSETAASTSAATATNEASKAYTSAQEAAASELVAQNWAEGDEPGGEGTKSSKQHAEDADNSAQYAAGQASNAAESREYADMRANDANTSATNAAASADDAETSAEEASDSASAALTSEQAAKQSEDNAASSASAAKVSEDNAKDSEESASTSASTATNQAGISTQQANTATTQAELATIKADEAEDSAQAAAQSESNAASSEQAAKSSETKSKTSETAAKSAENKAKEWASKDEDSVVESGLYSSKHYALKSSQSASQSAESASESASSAGSSDSRAKDAEDFRDEALAFRNTAEQHKTDAASSASSASSSATSASNSASTATTQANNAATSASNASDSEDAAKTHEDSAKGYADNAYSSADSSALSASEASASKLAAEGSAVEASDSAADALSYRNAANQYRQAAQSAKEDAESAAATATSESEKALSQANRAEGEADRAAGYADSMAGGLAFLGLWDASKNEFPDVPLVGSAQWKISAGGNLGGHEVDEGDTLIFDVNSQEFLFLDTKDQVTSVNGRTGAIEGLVETSEVSAVGFSGSYNDLIDKPNLNINNWNTAYGWGDHSQAGYALASRTISAGNGLTGGGSLSGNRTINLGTPGTISTSSTNDASGSTHTHELVLPSSATRGEISLANLKNESSSTLGFISGRRLQAVLSDYSDAFNSSGYNPEQWDEAYQWGDHSTEGYLKTVSWDIVSGKPTTATRWPTWSEVTSKPSVYPPASHSHGYDDLPISSSDVSSWNTAASWGNHASAGYAISGTGSTQVRTNSQLDLRYSRTDTTYSAGTGINLSGTTFSVSFGTAAGTVTEGNDSRLSNSREWTASTVSQAEAEAGTATTRRAWTAQRVRQNVANYTDSFSTTGDYSGLRARATTKADVGLGSVRNVSSYSQTESDARYMQSVSWGDVSSKPATATRWPSFDEVTGKPSTYTPSTHTHSNISVLTGDGLSGGGNLGSNRTLSVDTSVVRTSGDQTISGRKTLNVGPASSGATLTFLRSVEGSNGAHYGISSGHGELQISSLDNEGNGSYNHFGMDNQGRIGIGGRPNSSYQLTVHGSISGNGSGLTNLNASNLGSGTVPTARLPASALVGDTTYSAGTGLSLSGTTFSVDNPFNPSGNYSGLRARGTTAADVGAPPTSRTITAGDGLSGGGSLSSNRTLSVDGTVVRTSDIGTAASRDVGTSSGNLMEVGAFGLGESDSNVINNLDDQDLPAGLYSLRTSAEGHPLPSNSGSLLNMRSGVTGGATTQLYLKGNNNNNVQMRIRHGNNDGEFTEWEEVYHSGNFTPSEYAQLGTGSSQVRSNSQLDSRYLQSVSWGDVGSKPTTATRWPTWSEVTSKPSTMPPSSHTHSLSEITDAGDVAALNTNSSTSNFLRGDGTWVTPPNTNTTYSEITAAEVTAGTSSTLRTITGRRLKAAVDAHGLKIGTTSTTAKAGNWMPSAADVGAPPTSRAITAGDGLSGGGNLGSNRTLSVDSSVVRTSGTQTIGGSKTFSSPIEIDSDVGQYRIGGGTGTYRMFNMVSRNGNMTWYVDEDQAAGLEWRVHKGGSGHTNRFFMDFATGEFTANSFSGSLNASNLTGSVSDSRLPKSSNWDAAYTFSQNSDSFNSSGNYASLRARGTTKADVGLSNVPNWSGSTSTSLGTSNTVIPSQGAVKSYVDSGLSGKANTSGTYSIRATGTTKADVGLSGIPNTNGSTANFLRGDGSWVTPPNTTYSAGSGISLSGTTFSLSGDSFNNSGTYENLQARGIRSISGNSYDDLFGTTTSTFQSFFHSTGSAPSDSPTGSQSSGIHIGNTWGRAQIVIPNTGGFYWRYGLETSWFEAMDLSSNQTIGGNKSFSGTISGNGSGLTSLNASRLSSGTVSTSRLPAAALIGDTTYSAGTGLSLSGTTFSLSGDSFNASGNYASLRARGTTAADVGAPPTSRTISAGDGLSGGGSLSSNRILSVDSSVVRTWGDYPDLRARSTTTTDVNFRGTQYLPDLSTVDNGVHIYNFNNTGLNWGPNYGTALVVKSNSDYGFMFHYNRTGSDGNLYYRSHSSSGWSSYVDVWTAASLTFGAGLTHSSSGTLTFEFPRVGWLNDEDGNSRLYTSSSAASGMIFRQAAANQNFRWRDYNNNDVMSLHSGSGNLTVSGNITADGEISGTISGETLVRSHTYDVGDYVLATDTLTTTLTRTAVAAGSRLSPSNANGETGSSGGYLSGTWRAKGSKTSSSSQTQRTMLWQRIS